MCFAPPTDPHLPRAYGGCSCACHRHGGVSHVMPCCWPKDDDLLTLRVDDDGLIAAIGYAQRRRRGRWVPMQQRWSESKQRWLQVCRWVGQ